ncbi:MAG TPA: hypothetical protein DIT55_07800, partial [Spirochaetaceae bacterium]|nr:hypothetical protein [Spirochaetaceae bacterium]
SGSRSKGYYSIFQVGDSTVLDLNLVDETSLPSGRLSYIVKVRADDTRSVATLVLTPARILSDRAEPLYRPDLILAFVEN